MKARKLFSAMAILMIGAMILGACAPATAPPAQTIVQTVVVAGTPQVQTVVVTATPEAAKVKPVTVLSLWGGSEQEAFQKVLDGFTAKTGVPTQYEQARDFLPVIRTRLAAGNPPDIAIVPRPGVMAEFARAGDIVPLQGIVGQEVIPPEVAEANYSKAWIDLGSVDGQLYGIAGKANSKSVVWYRPSTFKELGLKEPKTWAELLAVMDAMKAAGKTPFAIGGKDGWTYTDWFENILVRVAGPDLYDQLVTHKIPWTHPKVKETMERFADIVGDQKNMAGGAEGANGTGFVDGIGLVFGPTPKAEMYYEGGFVGGIALGNFPTLKPGVDLAFFPFPEIDPQFGSPVVGGGDLAVMFNDTPEARQFMAYLASKEAGEIWAATGAIVSPNKTVDLKVYPNDLARAEAAQLTGATTFRFDASDLMPRHWAATISSPRSKTSSRIRRTLTAG
ncbi:MAG: carbohydrate ABC transporter substrate-binding protein [Chloroflexi bacterium]|nr:carbohydrate ABC transporter substrate-binding protein [Chloroflexota bacterium]